MMAPKFVVRRSGAHALFEQMAGDDQMPQFDEFVQVVIMPRS